MMDPCLYQRLFKYQANEHHTQLENFLTEAFCDLLNRIGNYDNDILSGLIKTLFGYSGNSRVLFRTQYRPQEQEVGIPDLVGFADGNMALVVEIKIAAGYSESTSEYSNEDSSQLKRYGEWLAKEKDSHGILVLLTHKTFPPEGFLDKGEKFGLQKNRRRVVFWRDVYLALQNLQKENNTKQLPDLVKDFLSFLKMRSLGMDFPTHKDFEKLEAYIGDNTASKIQWFMNTVREELELCNPALSWRTDKQHQSGGSFSPDYTQIDGWVYPRNTDDFWIGWAIYFAPDKSHCEYDEIYNIEWKSGLVLNVWHKEQEKIGTHPVPSGDDWYPAKAPANASAIAFKPLEYFHGDAQRMLEWFIKRFEEACNAYKLFS